MVPGGGEDVPPLNISRDDRGPFVSRAGQKLAAALERFRIDVAGRTCADLGSHVGGFVDCLLSRGAAKVYSVDTSYGTLAWKLRKDPRVAVMERKNALHVILPERVSLLTIDVGWTKQVAVLPNAANMLAAGGEVVTLIKPHYEAPRERLVSGVLPDELVAEVTTTVTDQMVSAGWRVLGTLESPIRGHGGNLEILAHLRRP